MNAPDLLDRVYPGRRADLKRAILRQALHSFNLEGIDSTTIEIIRSECGASVGAVYHHFKSKEGLIAALFFAALDDQESLRGEYLRKALSVEGCIRALVESYVDWVDDQPEWARFVLQARSSVATGPFKEDLAARNKQRNKNLFACMNNFGGKELLSHIPAELLPSLIIGQSESYSRAWLSKRVEKSPRHYRDHLGNAAWASIRKPSV
ncbi:TetR/AcrR family transcriptional regulator [Pseudomonas cichorii]|nr:TetR/AcrR family transcriptional regulator [Pseudomonas cichorii]MBX8474117.1 TetR/AcrR family transcriptional regulator [Pseudomonas cichorii]GFM48999.1 TetR family transcriptional regulator [Pseudomonas cichorii]